MDETFRMLAREHQAELEREAQNRRLARLAGKAPVPDAAHRAPQPRRRRLALFARPKAA